jgi:hypothetical protein
MAAPCPPRDVTRLVNYLPNRVPLNVLYQISPLPVPRSGLVQYLIGDT